MSKGATLNWAASTRSGPILLLLRAPSRVVSTWFRLAMRRQRNVVPLCCRCVLACWARSAKHVVLLLKAAFPASDWP